MAGSWPADLPQSPLLQGAGGSFAKTGIRTQMDAGVAKQRTRFTAAAKPFRASFECTLAQVQSLDAFWGAQGGAPFTFAHPVYGAVSVRFNVDEPPTWQPRDDPNAFEVQCSFEVMP